MNQIDVKNALLERYPYAQDVLTIPFFNQLEGSKVDDGMYATVEFAHDYPIEYVAICNTIAGGIDFYKQEFCTEG